MGAPTCHAASAGGLRMRNDATWKDQLVRVASVRGAPSARVEPGHSANSFLITALNPSGTLGGLFPMPPGSPFTAAELDTVRAWIDGMPGSSGCATCAANSPGLACPAPHADVPGNEALAYLIAMNLTDNIWSQVMGRPLTIAHNYSRNMAQNFLLWHLTEFQFIANGWSLKKLLGFTVASDYYNRRPPEDGDGIVKPSGGSSPYDLPMFFDPWIEQDPRVAPANQPGYVAADHPEKHANAMSEAIERKAPVALLRSVGSALGWPMPQRVPQTTFPDRDLAVSIGQFMRDSVPGFRGENLTAFIEWEANVATCRKPAGVAADWIDRLTTAIQSHNTANPGDRVTVAQAAEIVKDWILADGRMSTGERAIVARVFGRAENDPTTLVTSLNDRLRDFCGVLLETPQFKLSGISADGVGPRPKLRVCNGAPCSYRELCTALLPRADVRALCQDQSIRSLQPEISSRPLDDRFAMPWPPRPPRWDADRTHTALASETIQRLAAQPSDFRLAVNPKQLRQAGVQRAKGVAILEPSGLKVLTVGSTIPADAIVVSEKGAELRLTVNRATIPVQLSGQQLAEGSIQELDRQLAKVPNEVRERAIKAARAGIPLAEMARPQHAISPVPSDTVDTALSSAFPFGSAGEPIGSAKPVPFDDKPLQERFEKARRLQR
jgi:hypothetical protein